MGGVVVSVRGGGCRCVDWVAGVCVSWGGELGLGVGVLLESGVMVLGGIEGVELFVVVGSGVVWGGVWGGGVRGYGWVGGL